MIFWACTGFDGDHEVGEAIRFVAEAGAVARIGVVGCAGMQLHVAREGHYQNVAHVGVARAAEMGMTEPYDGLVAVLIAGAVVVGSRLILAVDIVWDGVGVWTELDGTKRITGSWKGVSHPIGSYDRVNILGVVVLRHK